MKPGLSLVRAIALVLTVGAREVRADAIFLNQALFEAAAGNPILTESFEGFTATNSLTTSTLVAADFTMATGIANTLGVRNSGFGGLHATDGTEYVNWLVNTNQSLTFTFGTAIQYYFVSFSVRFL